MLWNGSGAMGVRVCARRGSGPYLLGGIVRWNKFSSPTKVSKRAGLEQSFLTAGFRVCVKNVGVGKIENKKPSPFCDLSIEAGLRRPAALDRESLVSRRRPPRAVRSELHSC